MSCQACGTEQVSLEARQASERLATPSDASRAVLEENFGGQLPTELCATCFLPAYAHALEVGVKP